MMYAVAALAAEMPAAYAPVIDAYRRALAEHWEKDADKLAEHGIPDEFFRWEGRDPELVASLIDIDGDGSPELVIYSVSEAYYGNDILWNAYTIKDGKPVRLFVGRGRDRWYLTRGEDGAYLFENEGSGGATNLVNCYYTLKDGKLVFVHGVIYDEDSMNAMNGEYHVTGDESKIVAKEPWFTTATDQRGDSENTGLEPSTEEYARSVTAGYKERRFFPEGERIVP